MHYTVIIAALCAAALDQLNKIILDSYANLFLY